MTAHLRHVMKQLTLLCVLVAVASACTSEPDVAALPTTQPATASIAAPTSPATAANLPTPNREPSLSPTLAPATVASTSTPGPEVPILPASFADFPGNQATGELAPDFTARAMGGVVFTLSEQRGVPVLVLPTVIGCADCVFSLTEIAIAYQDFRDTEITVVVLNLYPDDTPGSWQNFVDLIGEPGFVWSVVSSTDFVIDYNITTLGTTLLIDANGRLVFRREYPLQADEFRRLFTLVTQ